MKFKQVVAKQIKSFLKKQKLECKSLYWSKNVFKRLYIDYGVGHSVTEDGMRKLELVLNEGLSGQGITVEVRKQLF